MSLNVGGTVCRLLTNRNLCCAQALHRLFAAATNGTTLVTKQWSSTVSSSKTEEPPVEEEFSCTSTKVVTPRRAYTGSHAPEPPDPLTCCGSGCADCVWIEYGTQLMHYYSDKPLEEALHMIDDQIMDVCMREYVKSEVRAKARHKPF